MASQTFNTLADEFGEKLNVRIMELVDELETIIQDAAEYVRPYEAEQVAMLFGLYAKSAHDSNGSTGALRAAETLLQEVNDG